MKKRKITRRRFIKNGLIWTAGTATSLGSFQNAAANKKILGVSRTSLKPLRAIPTTCEQCPAGCGIIAYLDGERLVQILGNPAHPNNRGGICAKGIAGLNLVNDPERVLYPMKRQGTRGEGRWSRITWDEVYSALSKHIKEMIRDGRTSECVFDKGKNDPLLDLFTDSLEKAHIIDRHALKNLNRDRAYTSMTGSPSLIEDVGESRIILNFGANPYANHDQFIAMARRLVLARVERGARLFTFDVRLSETAAKSDAWYPIKAGTDGIVALAMAGVIVERGLADRVFMDQKTNSTLSMIRRHLSPYTPEVAEKESGVRAADIERLAIEFATTQPSVAITGGGISDHMNGNQNVRCVALLNWLTGNLEKKGGLFFPRFLENSLLRGPYARETRLNSNVNFKGIVELQETGKKIDTYFTYFSNPAYSEPDCKSTERLLKDEKIVPFLVVMDTHLTETAMLADMVLPAATYLEGWGVSRAPSLDRTPILNLRQPVVSLLSTAEVLRSPSFDVGKLLEPSFRPRGKSKEVGNFCLELARRIEGDVFKNLPYRDTKDYINTVISSLPLIKTQGGLDALKTKGFWMGEASQRKNSRMRTNKKIRSGSKKIEIYSSSLGKKGFSPLPAYQSIAFHSKKGKNEFVLTPFKSNLTASGTANSKWAREILHGSRLWINKKAAAHLGIKNGDRVRVDSPAGAIITRVLTTSRIHPDSVALAEGLGHTAVGNVAKARRFKSKDQDTNLIWWSKKGSGVNPKEVIERREDSVGRGLGLKDTVVRIKKIV